MKRKAFINRLMAASLAMAMVFGCAATQGLTVHAQEDLWVTPGEGDDGHKSGGYDSDDSGSDSGSGNSNNGYSSGGSHDSGNSNDGSGNADSSYSGASSDSGSYETGSSDAGSTASTPIGLALKGNTVTVPGYETWRQVVSPSAGTFKVYHKGNEEYTAQLKDKDNKAVAFKSAGMIQTEDGKWYINIQIAEEIASTDYTVSTAKGSMTYLTKLGINGVMLNGTVAVDAEAAVAAATTK